MQHYRTEWYMQKKDKTEVLDKETQLQYVREAQAGDDEKRNLLLMHSIGLVMPIAYKYTSGQCSFEDLCQEGMIGLIEAVDAFDFKRKVSFPTCAVFYILRSIYSYVEKTRHTIRIPCYVQQQGRKISKKIRQGKPISEKEREIYKKMLPVMLSLDRKINETSNEEFHEIIPDARPGRRIEQIDAEIDATALLDGMGLTKRQSDVITRRKGGETLKSIGKSYGVTREWIRQIELKALKRIRIRAEAWEREGRKI